MKTQKLFILMILGLSLTACSDSEQISESNPNATTNPSSLTTSSQIQNTLRIDATNYETFEASIKAIEKNLTKGQKVKFMMAREGLKTKRLDSAQYSFSTGMDAFVNKSLHDLTMREVFIKSHNKKYDMMFKINKMQIMMRKDLRDSTVKQLGGEDKLKKNISGEVVMDTTAGIELGMLQVMIIGYDMSLEKSLLFTEACKFISLNAYTFYETDDKSLDEYYARFDGSRPIGEGIKGGMYTCLPIHGMTGLQVIEKAKQMHAEMIKKGYKPIGSFE